MRILPCPASEIPSGSVTILRSSASEYMSLTFAGKRSERSVSFEIQLSAAAQQLSFKVRHV